MDEKPAEPALETWVSLTRRTFGIPDLVSYDAAMKAAEEILRKSNQLELADQPEGYTMERAVLEAVQWAGAFGLLDECIAGVENSGPAALEVIKGKAVHQGQWKSTALADALIPMADRLLSKMIDFVRAHPFQDESGTYFGG